MSQDLVDAMLPHAETLEYLHINLQDDWPYPFIRDTQKPMGVGLERMIALKWLAAGMQALTGTHNPYSAEMERRQHDGAAPLSVDNAPKMIDCLPPNLEYLQINYCGRSILPQMQELLDARAAGRFSRLRTIHLLFQQELISLNDINLRFDPAIVQVEMFLQSEENRDYDLIPRVGARCINACTRIFADDVRYKWLRFRCRDVARATIDEGVLFEPES